MLAKCCLEGRRTASIHNREGEHVDKVPSFTLRRAMLEYCVPIDARRSRCLNAAVMLQWRRQASIDNRERDVNNKVPLFIFHRVPIGYCSAPSVSIQYSNIYNGEGGHGKYNITLFPRAMAPMVRSHKLPLLAAGNWRGAPQAT